MGYPVRYFSKSRGAYIDLDNRTAMPDRHLLNAFRKLKLDPTANDMMLECMELELAARGLDPQYENGHPPDSPPVDAEGL